MLVRLHFNATVFYSDINVTPADQMSDKLHGFDIWRECHLKPDGMTFRFAWKINL